MNALDYALLVLGLLVVYFIFFKKKRNEENVCLEKVEIEEKPLLEEIPMSKDTFVRPTVEKSKKEEVIIPIKKVEKIKPIEKPVNKSLSKKVVVIKSSNKDKGKEKRVYNKESENNFKKPYRQEDTMNHIAPVLPIYENETSVPLYEPSMPSPTVIDTSSNDVSFNNSNDGFGGSGASGEY